MEKKRKEYSELSPKCCWEAAVFFWQDSLGGNDVHSKQAFRKNEPKPLASLEVSDKFTITLKYRGRNTLGMIFQTFL